MADTDTQTPNTADAIARLYQQLMAPPPALPTGTPDNGASPSWTGLLGRVLGGGQAPGYQLRGGEADTSGNRALLNFGINTLLASGPHAVRPDLLSSVATGLQGAQESLGQDQSRAGALAAAQFQAQREGRADQLARIREAIPLLQLQQQLTGSANTQKLLSGNTGGDGTYVGAIGGHEGTGQNPGSSAVGTGQFLRDTWLDFARANPQYFQGMSEKQILDSRTVPEFSKKVGPVAIEWLAKQNADALTNAGVPPSGPVLGIAHYVGAGAAANIAKAPDSTPVARFVGQAALDANPELRTMTVGQMKARYANTPNPSFMSAPAPGQAGVPAPASLTPSAPGAKTQIPPPTVAAPGQATPPARGATIPSEPPLLAGGAQTAGGPGAPGAPTSGVIPTLPPAAAAASATDVAQIESGMANARANPITPGAQPGAVVTAQAGGQQPPATQLPPIKAGEGLIQHPGVYKDYFTREAAPVPTTEDFSPNLSPARQAQFDEARKGIQFRIANRMNLPSAQQAAEGTKIGEDRAALEASIQKEIADKSQAAAANTTAWIKTQDAAVRPRYEQELKDYGTAAQSTLTSQQKLDEIKATSDAGVDAASLKDLNTSGEAARKIRDQTSQLMQISREAGDPSILTALPSVANAMGAIGLLAPEKVQQLGAQRAFDTGINTMIGDLRKQEGMSRMTDADLKFLVNTVGSSTIPEALRLPMLAVINSAADRHAKYVSMVNELRGIPGMTTSRARDLADEKLGHVIPTMPSEFPNVQANDAVGLENAQNAWRNSEVTPGTFYIKRKPDGTLKLSIRPVQDPSAQPQVDQR